MFKDNNISLLKPLPLQGLPKLKLLIFLDFTSFKGIKLSTVLDIPFN